MKKKWLLFFLLMKLSCAFAQNPIGLPNIISFYRSDYNGGLQNRSIVQDKNGIIYFANSEGLLSFDGTYWNLYPLPNKTIIRSIAFGKDGRIYAGGQNEMGYFSPNKTGNLVFTSLKSLLPEKITSFKDIWDIVSYDDKIFFRSQSNIFQFDGKFITAYQPVSQWQFLGSCNGQLIAQDAAKGLFQFSNGEWAPLTVNKSLPQDLAVTALLHLSKDSILITTLKKGLFVLNQQKVSGFKFKGPDPFLNQQIMCAMAMDDGHLAVGTHMGGLYIIDKQGRILQNFTRKEGLQNNTVLSLFLDKDRNLWMGLDDGIDFNAYNSAIKHIYPEKLNEGAGYSAIVFDRVLYIGTSNWLYQLPVMTTRT